ncbi:sorting nexin-29, partial [Asbolus verrucosus]
SLRLMSAVISTSLPSQVKPESSDKLLKQLLECVQECQKRYGGKTELATEFDSCVVALCLTLEAVLLHGIRTKPQDNPQTSALKQVSDIVTNSFHIGAFWPFVKKHLTKHEQERYAVLKHIWTDTGRGRAWIRSSLNERSLERYFHILLSNLEVLKNHYEDYAILRDQEKSTMLPNMAAGVGSILFAISIDKPELNSGIPQRIENLKSKAEPIIEAPIPENKERQKNKKKKKVARQFISFDDDDSSVLSTSVPSTSSSISSDSNSTNDNQSSKSISKHHLKDIVEEKKIVPKMDKVASETDNKLPAKRKLSIETSGSRDKFTSDIPETLTPVSQAEIGELTPVSVEINKHFESPDVSDDILEVPTDISAVLTALETRNKEELKKKQDKIEALIKENDILKEQVKKYVGAIQMLQKDDALQEVLDSLQIEQQPDYKGEAKLFERKLVQVAEMHAELMDFNVALQQSLCQKDLLLERLKSELEELRGPMPTDELVSETTRGSVNVWIPSAFLTGSGSNSHHVYQIFLRAGNDEWNIYRRYAQFYALHTDLKKLDPAITTFDFPPKKSIGKK